jgi:hypothetical protein
MMSGWIRQLALTAKARTGFGTGILVCYLIAILSVVVAFGFLCAAAFIWLASLCGALIAALILAGAFFLIAIIAVLAAVLARRHNQQRARLELAAVSRANLLDPKLLTIGLEVGRAIGWGRIAALGAVGLFAAGLSKEWRSGRRDKAADKPPEA